MGRARDVRLAYLLLAPALLLLLTALAYPVGWEVWTSFTDLSPLNDRPTAFVGLDNYRRLAADPAFWRAALNTVAYAAVTSAVKLSCGPVALISSAATSFAWAKAASRLTW